MSEPSKGPARPGKGHEREVQTASPYAPPVPPSTASLQPPCLSEKIARARARRLAQCPVSARALLGRCYAKKASPRQAIKAFCQECCGYDRAAIIECMGYACPLWHFRPYQRQ
jgi:hypothetical protein